MVSKIRIEKNIPAPCTKNGVGRSDLTRALRAMRVGDSFIIPSRYTTTMVYSEARRTKRTVVIRLVDKEVRRVWRCRSPRRAGASPHLTEVST